MTPAAYSKCKSNIMRHESYRQMVYTDTQGNLTVGYGHNLTANGVSEDLAELLLLSDMKKIEKELLHTFPLYANLNDARQAVILEMGFNLGVASLMQFRVMLKALAEKDYILAAKAMLDSVWAEQVGNRAHDLAHLMESGVI